MNDGALATVAVIKTLAAAKGLGEVRILFVGTAAATAETARLYGACRVLHANHDACHLGMAETIAAQILSLAGGYSHIAAAVTAFCKNVLQRAAALPDVMVIPDVTVVDAADRFEWPISAGSAIQKGEIIGRKEGSDRPDRLLQRRREFRVRRRGKDLGLG